jgi:hypothetical protein
MSRLRGIARTHIAKAEAGDMQAIKELADRLDGRPAQMLVTEGTQDVTMRRALTYQIVTKTPEQIERENDNSLLIEYDGEHSSNGEHSSGSMSSEHFGQLAWQFKRTSGSSGLKVQAAIAC